jgi:hypothetical protein
MDMARGALHSHGRRGRDSPGPCGWKTTGFLLRNKLPRTPGQGTIRQAKVITGISGSQTGPSGGKFTRLAIPELVQSGGAISGTSSSVNWPLNLPGTGTQDAVDLKIPSFWGPHPVTDE